MRTVLLLLSYMSKLKYKEVLLDKYTLKFEKKNCKKNRREIIFIQKKSFRISVENKLERGVKLVKETKKSFQLELLTELTKYYLILKKIQ